jgi:hypothetical protein
VGQNCIQEITLEKKSLKPTSCKQFQRLLGIEPIHRHMTFKISCLLLLLLLLLRMVLMVLMVLMMVMVVVVLIPTTAAAPSTRIPVAWVIVIGIIALALVRRWIVSHHVASLASPLLVCRRVSPPIYLHIVH